MRKKKCETTILIVEDDSFFYEALESRLTAEGYQVAIASDGGEVMDLLYEVHPDYLTLDMVLPKKSGLEVLKEIRADKYFSTLPVMVITSLEHPGEKQALQHLGIIAYIIKSELSLTDMVERIKDEFPL